MINVVISFSKRATTGAVGVLKRAQFASVGYAKRALLAFQTGLFFIFKQNSDEVSITDVHSSGIGKSPTNPVSLTDSINRTVDFKRAFTDTAAVTDNFNRSAQFSRTFQDGAQIGDSYTDQVNFNRSPQDVTTFSDHIDYFGINKNIADTVSVTDDTNGALIDDDQVANFTKLRQDGFNVLDSLSSSTIKVFEDGYSVQAIVKSGISKSLTDSYNIYTQVYSDVYKVSSDNFIVSDSLTTINQFNRSPDDTTQFGDLIDSFQIGKGNTDVLQILETISNGISTTRSDNYLVSDNLATSVNYWRTPQDSLQLSENYYLGINKNPTDITQLSDSALVSIGYLRNFADSIYATDDINGTAVGDDQLTHVFKVKSDGTNITDTITTSINRSPSDSTGVADSGIMYFQNYAGNYFSADYVGGSRAFT